MQDPINVPEDESAIHPWIADMMTLDDRKVQKRLIEHFSFGTLMPSEPLHALLYDFLPERIVFHQGRGYVQCVTYEEELRGVKSALYLPEPTPDSVVEERAEFFDDSCREIMREYLRKMPGLGEEISMAGQFHECSDTTSITEESFPGSLTYLHECRILYLTGTGDMVIINRHGELTWFVSKALVDDLPYVPIFNTLEEFLLHYVGYREIAHEYFDAYRSIAVLGKKIVKLDDFLR